MLSWIRGSTGMQLCGSNGIRLKNWLNVDWGHMCVAAYVYQELRMGVGVLLTSSSKLSIYFS